MIIIIIVQKTKKEKYDVMMRVKIEKTRDTEFYKMK